MADRFDLINFGKSVVTTTGGTTANVNIDANTLFIDGTNNRVGVGTNAPTAALQVAGDIVSSGTIVPASSYLRNRIINGDMRIDQRNGGASVAVTSSSPYTVDRWVAGMVGANGTAQRVSSSVAGFTNQVTLTGTSSTTTTWFGTRLESVNCSDLVGQTVILSFWAASSNQTSILARLQHANTSDGFGNGGTVTLISSVSVAITSTMTRYTVVYTNLPAGAANGLYVEFVSGGSLGTGTMSFTGVQLEVGSVATPFERRQFGQELALCQRYFQRIDFDINFSYGAQFGTAGGNNGFYGSFIPYTQTMRATPTGAFIATGGAGNFWTIAATNAFSGNTTANIFIDAGVDSCRMRQQPRTGGSAGNPVDGNFYLWENTFRITLSAEL